MLVHECLVGALETSAPPKRVAWVWQDAIPSYDCSVGALLALASGKAERRQVHPLGEVLWVLRVLWEDTALLGWCSRDCCTP